ncbi:ubiquitin fusion degradation protein UFD1-domain-containing protein [Radiomyces spectabilis]|uniref:ubiquitin fusion degradation protein UFD1-domain-containing protein n=1 Tax=Radiomyces spectabilis TaxID=64574 RepID=UPI00221F87D0|nr:ubiquitin fusion degradation protein UFD1-domain-containing protein [Radiomyces spectabilis]KAI8393317.1 ubiquitin fusion degradation protein UFD1-domain-containing protein [Radiomyces spectabilis]
MFNGDNFEEDDPFSPAAYLGGIRHPFMSNIMNPNRKFTECYRCYPMAMMQHGNERENVNYGGKIILPQSALEKLSQLNISYPMLFRLINAGQNRHTHAGVLEFIAEEGRAYLPQWMMQSLNIEPGDLLEVKNTTLPLGSFVKIQPQSIDFLDISDPKAVLENALRNFSTLTVGDIVQINYNDKVYEIKVLEVKPNFEEHSGISIVETDLEVDFAPPVGYVEPTKTVLPTMKSQMIIDEEVTKPTNTGFAAFHGSGRTLRGKDKQPVKQKMSEDGEQPSPEDMDLTESAFDPNDDGPLNLPFGQLYFGFPLVTPKSKEEAEEDSKSRAFKGAGQTLRSKKVPSASAR